MRDNAAAGTTAAASFKLPMICLFPRQSEAPCLAKASMRCAHKRALLRKSAMPLVHAPVHRSQKSTQSRTSASALVPIVAAGLGVVGLSVAAVVGLDVDAVQGWAFGSG